ncbi:hypothetical protein ACIRPK_24150 [Kitasatospora sp. NPDC101801]|uniref:hypothetical protein n=1 Tax=Kitasatospora sp. NPDC101801 TaxID=3364103 RepID=UPI003809273C
MASKMPPKVLQPLVPHLHRLADRAVPERAKAFRAYDLQRLRRDRVAKHVPLPGTNGVTYGDALLAAGVAALGWKSGHLCHALRWYLLALNPEEQAVRRLRLQLGSALDRLPQDIGPNTKPMRMTLAHETQLNRAPSQRAAEVRAALLQLAARLDDPQRSEATNVIDQHFPGVVDPLSKAVALRAVRGALDRAFGSALTDDTLTAVGQPNKRLSDTTSPLYDFLLESEGFCAYPGMVARATDPGHVRGLLAEADDNRLRYTVQQFCRPSAALVDGCDHRGQHCKPACRHAAWMICLHLDPAQFRRWEMELSSAAELARLVAVAGGQL